MIDIDQEELEVEVKEITRKGPQVVSACVEGILVLAHVLSEENKGQFEFGREVLTDVAAGDSQGLITHNAPEFELLAQELSVPKDELEIHAIACPPYSYEVINGKNGTRELRPTLKDLWSGTPSTALVIKDYALRLRELAKKFQRRVSLHGHIVAWNPEHWGLLPDISQEEAQERIALSAEAAQKDFSELNVTEYFRAKIDVTNPPGLMERVRQMATQIQQNESRTVREVYNVRKRMYGPQYDLQGAALEIAESRLAWTEACSGANIRLVCTAPIIARATMPPLGLAYIQQTPDRIKGRK